MSAELLDRSTLESLRFWRSQHDAARLRGTFRDLPAGIDPYSLADTGWGILIAPEEAKRGVLTKLEPLLALRRSQAGEFYHEETFEDLSARDYLWVKHGDSPGTIHPGKGKLPYYLLIVGSPTQIPFQFQFDLAVNRAVGRLYFEDLEHYSVYAEAACSVAAWEARQQLKEISLFSVTATDENGAIRQIEDHFLDPLKKELVAKEPQWLIRSGKDFEPDFVNLLQGDNGPPGLLITACHGLQKGFGSPDQKNRQGALNMIGTKPDLSLIKKRFTGADLRALAAGKAEPFSLQGTIVALFACYSAGTPQVNNLREVFSTAPDLEDVLAESPFLASLPTAMLSTGALAVLGHVDKGLTASFVWKYGLTCTSGARSLIDSLLQLLAGHRLGHALRPLFRRYSYLAAHMLSIEEARVTGNPIPESDRNDHLAALQDAKGFVLLGDPAVTLKGTQRPARAASTGEENRDNAEAVFLNPNLVTRARAEAATRGLNLTAWVQELLENELNRTTSKSSGDLATVKLPIPISVLSSSGHTFLPQAGSLICLANSKQPPQLWIEEKNPGVWCVAAQARDLLDGPHPNFGSALEALLKWARVLKLKDLAATKPTTSIELTFYQKEAGETTWTACLEDRPTLENDSELRIDVQNLSNEPVWLYLLDIGPDGGLNFIQAARSQSAPLAPGEKRVGAPLRLRLPELLPEAAYHLGALETLIAFSTADPVDIGATFHPSALTVPESGPLSRILADLSTGQWRESADVATNLTNPNWGIRSCTLRIPIGVQKT